MKKIREYWDWKWEIDTEPKISGQIELGNWETNDWLVITHSFRIKILSPERYAKEPSMCLDIIKLIWTLEEAWVFDKSNTLTNWYTLDNLPYNPTPYNPLQPYVMYWPGNTVLCSNQSQACQCGITELWENGSK